MREWHVDRTEEGARHVSSCGRRHSGGTRSELWQLGNSCNDGSGRRRVRLGHKESLMSKLPGLSQVLTIMGCAYSPELEKRYKRAISTVSDRFSTVAETYNTLTQLVMNEMYNNHC